MTDDPQDASVLDDPHEHLRSDPALAPLVDEHGPLTVEPAEDPFRRLVVSVLRQQVSMDAAAAIRERLFDAVGQSPTSSQNAERSDDRIEVTPEGVLAADEAAMRDAGVSAAKVEYLRALAERWQAEGYSRASFEAMDDDAVRAELTEIRGVGDWTADMFLMFGLGREDVFPVGDLGIRKGMRRHFDEEMTRGEMVDRAERWQPYRSYASRYLWADGD